MNQHTSHTTGESASPENRDLRLRIAQLTAENERLNRSRRALLRMLRDAWSSPQRPGTDR